MVKVTAEDVVVRSPKSWPPVRMPDPKARMLHDWRVLKEPAGGRVLPIWLHPRAGRGVAEGAR